MADVVKRKCMMYLNSVVTEKTHLLKPLTDIQGSFLLWGGPYFSTMPLSNWMRLTHIVVDNLLSLSLLT